MAIMGGNLELVRWLANRRRCPLRGSNTAQRKKKSGTEGPLLTSKGMSPLMLAVQHHEVDILRFLVAEKGVSLLEEQRNLDSTSILIH